MAQRKSMRTLNGMNVVFRSEKEWFVLLSNAVSRAFNKKRCEIDLLVIEPRRGVFLSAPCPRKGCWEMFCTALTSKESKKTSY